MLMIRSMSRLVIITIATSTVPFAAAANASAACDLSNHCYGVVAYDGTSGFDGASAVIDPRCIAVSDGDFTTQELWVTNNTSLVWVEVGYMYNLAGVPYLRSGLQTFFWAKRSDGSTVGGTIQSNPAATARKFTAVRATSSAFDVSVDGQTVRISTGMYAGKAQAGVETTTKDTQSWTSITSLRTKYADWSPTWPGSFVSSAPPMDAFWTTPGSAAWAGKSC